MNIGGWFKLISGLGVLWLCMVLLTAACSRPCYLLCSTLNQRVARLVEARWHYRGATDGGLLLWQRGSDSAEQPGRSGDGGGGGGGVAAAGGLPVAHAVPIPAAAVDYPAAIGYPPAPAALAAL